MSTAWQRRERTEVRIPRLIMVLAAISNIAYAQDPEALPLIQKSDLEYVGSFALPATQSGTSRFGYGGKAVIPYTDSLGRTTLYMQGHNQKPGQVAQVEVPASLSKVFDYPRLAVAKQLQPFADITDGSLSTRLGITSPDGASIYGLFPYQGRLIVSAAEYYGCTQTMTHGLSSLDLSLTSDFAGFFEVDGAANPRSIAGPMAEVPQAWRTRVGGSVLTGNWGIPLIGCNSPGPALTAFNPEDLGGKSPVPGSTLLFHSLGHALCEGAQCSFPDAEAHTSGLYNLTTALGGAAFPDGSRSVLILGRHGTGTYCYGTPAECGGDPVEADAKGPHAYPYRYQIWAYDVKDLLRVKDGALKSYEPRPYAVWRVDDLEGWRGAGYARIEGAGFDNKSNRWYVTTSYSEQPRVDVFQIKPAGTGVRNGPQSPPGPKVRIRQDRLAGSVIFDIPGHVATGLGPLRYRVYDIQGREVADVTAVAPDAKASWNTAGRFGGVFTVLATAKGIHLVSQLTLLPQP